MTFPGGTPRQSVEPPCPPSPADAHITKGIAAMKKIFAVFAALILLLAFSAPAEYTFTDADLTYRVLSDGTAEITKFAGSAGEIEIPSVLDGRGVSSISDYAFYECEGLVSVTIPEGVTNIGQSAFEGCESLVSVTIPEGVASMGERAFYGCESLTSVVVPGSLTFLPESAFEECKSLTSAVILDGVASIGGNAFYRCKSLVSAAVPASVTYMGDRVFFRCGDELVVTVEQGSYAERYCVLNYIDHSFPAAPESPAE